ncbi:MAG: protein-tyrosine phosphatase family protein [Actinomycetota bacterium]
MGDQSSHSGHGPHRHRDPVALPDGRTVVGCSHPNSGYGEAGQPDFGLYLDPRWDPPWPHDHLDWPDFGLPTDRRRLVAALSDVLDRAASGQTVELGCLGGHGRTGTALALLAVMVGCDEEPVRWVRRVYCGHAIETEAQAELVRGFAAAR